MTPPTENSNLLPADFDLGQIFIGREQQLNLFHIYLDRWKHDMITASDSGLTTAPSPNNKLQGLLALLYGRGGFGKSTLLKHYHDIVAEDDQRFVVSEIVDWEFAIEGKRSLFNPPPGREVDAPEYFTFLCSQLAGALKKGHDEFKEHQAAVKAVEEAKKQATSVLDSLQKDDRFASLRLLAGPGAITLLSWIAPRVGQVLDSAKVTEKVEEVIGQGAQIGAEQLVHAYSKLHDKLGHKLGDYLDPALRLGLALGRDLSHMAKNFPLLICFDTYEEVDEADHLLRIVMGAAGTRVGWVLAGRDNLWAGYEQRKRSIAKVYGYKEIVLPGLGLAIDFNAGGIGSFTTSDIVEYFSLLRKKVPIQLALPAVTEEEAECIWEVTQGVPLVVKIAAGLYLEHANLEIITEKPDGKREIVDEMVQRYLLHTRDDQHERARLYGLAMLRRADYPAAVAAALGLSAEQARIRYESELSRLHRRYSFIFTEKAQPSLHQEVRHFLRLWLVERRNQPAIIAVNERLKEAHEAALKKLEDHRQYSTLRERLEDEEWVGVYLDLAEQQFWLDPAEGVRYALLFMIVATIYLRSAIRDIIEIGKFFIESMGSPYRNWWQWAFQGLNRYLSRGTSTGLDNLVKLESHSYMPLSHPLLGFEMEIKALLWWRLGDAHKVKNKNKALTWYEKALTVLHNDSELKDITARTYWDVANNNEKKKQAERLSFLNRAIELKSNYVAAYYSRGIVYSHQKKYQEAIADFDHAIELDPRSALIYVQKGITYRHQKKYQEAIMDFERAIELDPRSAWAYFQRGITYGNHLDEHQRAMIDFDRAIELEPKLEHAYVHRGRAYRWRKEYQRAIADFDSAIALNPNHAWAYASRSQVYTDLGNYEEAIAGFDHAITLEPRLAGIYKFRGDAYLWMKNTMKATADYRQCYELDPTRDDAAWMEEWARMSVHRPSVELAERLEAIAAMDRKRYTTYISHVCRGVALGLRNNLKDGLAELERALMLESEIADCYFWKGMLSAYYYRGRPHTAIESIEKSLAVGLPPVLLTPLHWLEKDLPDFYEQYATPLLARYSV